MDIVRIPVDVASQSSNDLVYRTMTRLPPLMAKYLVASSLELHISNETFSTLLSIEQLAHHRKLKRSAFGPVLRCFVPSFAQ